MDYSLYVDFEKKYSLYIHNYPDAPKLQTEVLDKIKKVIDGEIKYNQTMLFMFSTSLLFITIIAIIYSIFDTAPKIAIFSKMILSTEYSGNIYLNIFTIILTIGLSIIIIIAYFNKKFIQTLSFIFFKIFFMYMLSILSIIDLAIFYKTIAESPFLTIFIVILLFLLFVYFVMFLAFYLGKLVAIINFNHSKINAHYWIIILTIHLLNEIKGKTNLLHASEIRKDIIHQISLISKFIESLNIPINNDIGEWTMIEFEKISLNFRSLSEYILIPSSSSVSDLVYKLKDFLEKINNMNYGYLPRGEIEKLSDFSGKNRTLHKNRFYIIGIGIFIGFPIILNILLTLIFKISIPSTLSYQLAVLYIIWLGIGLLFASAKLNFNFKDVLDFLKSVKP